MSEPQTLQPAELEPRKENHTPLEQPVATLRNEKFSAVARIDIVRSAEMETLRAVRNGGA